MQAAPNNQSYSRKMLAGIVALLAAGTLGGYTVNTLVINNGTPIKGHLSKTFTIPSMVLCDAHNPASCASYQATSSFVGVKPNDSYVFSPSADIAFGSDYVSLQGASVATDTVQITLVNLGTTTTVPTSTFNVDVWQH